MFKFISIFLISILSVQAWADSVELKKLAIQEAGRIKPYDTFSRETLQLVYGKEEFEGKPAGDVVMTWVLNPKTWENIPIIEIKYFLLKQALKLPEQKKYFAPLEIWNNDRLVTLFQELDSKREAKSKLDPYDQSVARLENQLLTLRELGSGRMLRVFPASDAVAPWRSVAEMEPKEVEVFQELTRAFAEYIKTQMEKPGAADTTALDTAAKKFRDLARALNPQIYPSENEISTEVFYNSFHPYRWAWIVYALAALLLLFSWITNKAVLYRIGWGLTGLAIALHISGMALRIYLMGRPPVTNMFETVVWVGFGSVMFSLFIEIAYRWRFVLMAGNFVAAFCLVLANMAPAVLDPSLQPLEPVLRSNYWLTIHVMTITISYAAFFLAFILGDVALVQYLRGSTDVARLKALTLSIYRAMQIGVSFLTPGIILGGIWADYSWGRFWGWDPKETWALIVLLGYLAILHGRIVGWIKDFGLAVSSVIAFSLVIMAWYGVNFVLGAGLHSYGFGAGGVEYVATFVAAHFVFVAFVIVSHRAQKV